MIDRGEWTSYVPSEVTTGFPAGYAPSFWRNSATGEDWYDFRKRTWDVDGFDDPSGTTKVLVVNGTVTCVDTNVVRLSIQTDRPTRLFEFAAGEDTPERGQVLVSAGTFQAPPARMPALSRRQFYQGLVVVAAPPILTEDDFFAAMQGQLPQSLAPVVAQIAPDQQFTAKALLVGAQTFQRSNPLVSQVATLVGHDDAWLDDFWIRSAAL